MRRAADSRHDLDDMILGLGSDLTDITRIEKALARHGDRFLTRVFTPIEQARAARHPATRAASLAKRFAAKEACAKALGTGFAQGVAMRDIGVVNAPSGAPSLILSGGAAVRLTAMTPAGHRAVVHLSLSDEPPWAQAFVVIEGVIEPVIEGVMIP